MQLDRDWIARHIPHQGDMCLLDSVGSWDEQRIACRSVSHRSPRNPLRHGEQLAAICGVEYAAQSMAVHGALLLGFASKPGYLASVRAVRLHVRRLDDIVADLEVESLRLSGDSSTVMYSFTLCADGLPLLEGRATVVLDVAAFSVAPGGLRG
jgi:predicted hotdog family 3-hydroxylacyl-ACP dehydratase